MEFDLGIHRNLVGDSKKLQKQAKIRDKDFLVVENFSYYHFSLMVV